MKILIANDSPFALYYFRLGLAGVFSVMGHDVAIWDINKKSAFDMFDEYEPDWFLGQLYNLDIATFKCIKSRPNMLVSLRVGDRGNLTKEIDLKKYPILITTDKQFDLIRKLRDETGKPDTIDIHYHQDRMLDTHTDFINEKFNILGLMNAADVFNYTGGQFNEALASDIAFVGGRWGYKNVTISRWLIPLCNPFLNLNIKIFGNQGWGIPQYYGHIDDDNVKHVLASAVVCPNIHEPHSQDFGYDVVERPFKLLSNKCFVVTDYVEDLYKILPDSMIHCKTPQEYQEQILYFIEHPKEREAYIQRGYENVINNHTYFNRVESLFDALGLPEEVEKCRNAFTLVKDKLNL